MWASCCAVRAHRLCACIYMPHVLHLLDVRVSLFDQNVHISVLRRVSIS